MYPTIAFVKYMFYKLPIHKPINLYFNQITLPTKFSN
jgi:hypothetical protein